MCYNVKALLRSQLKRAKRNGIIEDVEAIQLQLSEFGTKDLFQASGFSHPKMLIYQTKDSMPEVATWGLVPHWVKDNDQRV